MIFSLCGNAHYRDAAPNCSWFEVFQNFLGKNAGYRKKQVGKPLIFNLLILVWWGWSETFLSLGFRFWVVLKNPSNDGNFQYALKRQVVFLIPWKVLGSIFTQNSSPIHRPKFFNSCSSQIQFPYHSDRQPTIRTHKVSDFDDIFISSAARWFILNP